MADLSDEILALIEAPGPSDVSHEHDDVRTKRGSAKKKSAGASSKKNNGINRKRSSGYDSDESYDDATLKNKKSSRRRDSSAVNDDDDEDGDTYSGTGDFDDSLSFDEGAGTDLDDNWNNDLMGDDSDREYLESLPEFEREKILSERAEKRQLLLEQKALQRKLRESYRLNSKSSGVAGAAGKRADKGSVKPEKKRKLDILKDRRAETKRKEQQRRYSTSSSSDEDGNMPKPRKHQNATQDDKERKLAQPSNASANSSPAKVRHPEPPQLTLEQVQAMQLKRDHVEKFCFASFFTDMATDAIVRLSVGPNSEGVPQYRIGQIKHVTKYKRAYKVTRIKTDIAFTLKHGQAERTFLADIFSNGPITSLEFARWKSTCEIDNVPLPTPEEAREKAMQISQALAHLFSDAEITDILRRKQELQAIPRNIALEKAELIKRRDAALSSESIEDVRQIDEKLAALRELADEQRRFQIEREQAKHQRPLLTTISPAWPTTNARNTVTLGAESIDSHNLSWHIPSPSAPGENGDEYEELSFQQVLALGPKLDVEL